MKRACAIFFCGCLMLAHAQPLRFPPPQFETNYTRPTTEFPAAAAAWKDWADVAALAGALCLAAWFVLRLRSRTAVFWLSIACLAYFGFVRHGCTCPIGAMQDVSAAFADRDFRLPATVALFFALPLAVSLLFGRVFCSGVCPLGAIQDIVLIRPVRVPAAVQTGLGILPWVYLGAAVLFSSLGGGFIICRFDPFVSFFRLSGPAGALVSGGVILAVSTVVGRPYCRFVCPYGPLLGLCARWAWKHAQITPTTCVDCSLCRNACPFGAILEPAPSGIEERR